MPQPDREASVENAPMVSGILRRSFAKLLNSVSSILSGTTAAKELAATGRVLIVDDEEAIRALAEFNLPHLGYKVCSATTALEGIELYRQKLQNGERFDCIILDLTFPSGMGGKEALKLLLEIDPSVNAI